MAVQAGLCLAWSETPEDTFCRVVAHFLNNSIGVLSCFVSDCHVTRKSVSSVGHREKIYNLYTPCAGRNVCLSPEQPVST